MNPLLSEEGMSLTSSVISRMLSAQKGYFKVVAYLKKINIIYRASNGEYLINTLLISTANKHLASKTM